MKRFDDDHSDCLSVASTPLSIPVVRTVFHRFHMIFCPREDQAVRARKNRHLKVCYLAIMPPQSPQFWYISVCQIHDNFHQ